MKLVAARRGGSATVTVNVQEAVRAAASSALHVTVEVPRENVDPLCGEHVVVTGGWPPTIRGRS
jgi:hypothetical protein